MLGSLPAQSQQMYPSQPSCQSQYHTQTKAFPSQQELNNNWTKVSYKRGRSTQGKTERETKQTKGSVPCLNQTSTSSRYTALEESENQQRKVKTNSAKPVMRTRQNLFQPIYLTLKIPLLSYTC
jgi:hypothetical protein